MRKTLADLVLEYESTNYVESDELFADTHSPLGFHGTDK